MTTPNVGDGATMCIGSDRYPYTVVKVTPKTITIREDSARCVSGNAHNSEAQEWIITPNLFAAEYIAWWSEKRQCYVSGGCAVYVGQRHRHHDPHF